MAMQRFALFDTAIGRCGIVWNERGISGVQLPEANAAVTRARLRRRHPAAVEAPLSALARRAVAGITALLDGAPVDLSDLPLELEQVPEFQQRVFAVARTIPAGATLTYGQIAARLGEPGAARAVGRALGANPWPIIVPCHRVLAAGGRPGGFSAPGGVATKLRLLATEGRSGFRLTGSPGT
ncbi:MAG: methylated-DNA--[protein]-cysteine S-methyltransferase [Gammaproteobacteria bacterium]|nr:methylated-DNA--[protein]-cysteine S-methyltransferase [Gammaproteobacteria bacterium]